MAPVTPPPSTETHAEIFESAFSVARTVGNRSDVSLSMILESVVGDAYDIRINGRKLIELLKDPPEPCITQERIDAIRKGIAPLSKIEIELTKKICLLMQEQLGLKACVYDDTAIEAHLKDPKKNPLPDDMKHALSLLHPAGFSHLAAHVGGRSFFTHGYHVPTETRPAVTMDLRKVDGGVSVKSFCGIQHLKSSKGLSSDLGGPQEKRPLIVFKTDVTLPVEDGSLKFQAVKGLLFEPSRLETIVREDLMLSSDPKYAPLKAMQNASPPLIDPEFDLLTDQTLQRLEFKNYKQKLLYDRITKKEQVLRAEGAGSGPTAAFNRHQNAPYLEALAQAKKCLMDPSNEHLDALRKINTRNLEVDALVKRVIADSQSQISTPAEIFESKFHAARQEGQNPDVALRRILADVVRDAHNITLNGTTLIELLASDPEPKITKDQIDNTQNLNDQQFQMRLAQKICYLMQGQLGLKACVYDQQAIEEHLNDPTNHSLPDPMKHALSLLSQAGFSHLAHNVGAGNVGPSGCSIDKFAATMDLRKAEDGDVVVSSSCSIKALISFQPTSLDTLDLPGGEPLITLKTDVTLPVSNGKLQLAADHGLVFEPCQLQTIVSLTVMKSNEPRFAQFQAMGKMTPPLINAEYETKSFLLDEITMQEQILSAEAERSAFTPFKKFRNEPFLEALAKARDCLMQPTDEKIAALEKINLSNEVDALMKSVIDCSHKALHPDPNIASSPRPRSP